MTATNHALTGALIGTMVGLPAVAIPLAFLSHFVLDALPHFGIKGVDVRNQRKIFWIVLFFDALILGSILLTLLFIHFPSTTHLWLILACMLAAISPDFGWIPRFFREIETKVVTKGNWFIRFHSGIQWSETPKGIIVEILYFLGAISLLAVRLA